MSATDTPPPDTVPARHYAAMFVAVGWLRGALYGVLADEVDKEQIQRLLESTSTAAIAKVFGLKEDDLFLDPDLFLTESQKRVLGGDRQS